MSIRLFEESSFQTYLERAYNSEIHRHCSRYPFVLVTLIYTPCQYIGPYWHSKYGDIIDSTKSVRADRFITEE